MSPMKMFEYLASGVPIVSSDLPVLREILHHSVNSLLVPAADLHAWISAVDSLSGNRQLADSLGTRAHQQYLSEHTWIVRANAILDFAKLQ